MTEKKDLGHGPVEEQPLTAQQQQELHEQEQYFRQAFCSVSCPPLPESLSADAMWEKICSGAGDHQVTVDPASMQEETAQQPQQETEAAPQKGKVIPFPQRTGKKERARRRTLAVACTLVLVVGLSVAYWQLRGPLGQVQGIVSGNSQASTAESAESAAAEATAADADTQTEESVEAVEEAAAPMMAAPPEEETASDETASGGAGQTEQRSAETQDAAIAPQSAQPQQEQATVHPKMQQEQNETDSQREELRQRILASIDAGQQEQSAEGNPDTGGSGQQQANQLTAQSAEATAEEPVEESVEESVEAVVPEQAETTDDTQQSDSVSILKNMMENAKENQPQSFQLKNGSVNYDPASGEVTVMDLNQQQTATLSLPAGAQVFASDVTLAAIVPDEQAQTVTLTLYSVEDLQNPQAVSTVTHQGELFDAYQSVSDSYTLVTSVWFDREQVEGGNFLPQVNGAELSPDQINIIEGYEQGDQVNYLITTTITPDSVKTRADLYLN